jgi:glycosyltransferase involved in cell wall biosynthesis
VAELRVGIDVSPLELTGAGTAPYLRNLVDQLAGVEVLRYAMPGSSRARKVLRDTAWYLGRLPRPGPRARALTFSTAPATGHRCVGVPLVVTIHDLAMLRCPDTFDRWTRVYSRLLLPRLARAATRVIAVSEFTAREAVELLGVDERRVRVILHGVDEPFAAEGLAANDEYLLAVGTVEPRKESRPLAEAARA